MSSIEVSKIFGDYHKMKCNDIDRYICIQTFDITFVSMVGTRFHIKCMTIKSEREFVRGRERKDRCFPSSCVDDTKRISLFMMLSGILHKLVHTLDKVDSSRIIAIYINLHIGSFSLICIP